jgi:hypothetical protein
MKVTIGMIEFGIDTSQEACYVLEDVTEAVREAFPKLDDTAVMAEAERITEGLL